MRIDVGKDAKRSGAIKPSEARKVDGAKPTRAAAGSKPDKPYGLEYEYRRFWPKNAQWKTERQWFKTAQQRDYAISRFWNSKLRWMEYYRDVRPNESSDGTKP